MTADPFHQPSRDPGDFRRSKAGAPYVSDPDNETSGKQKLYSRISNFGIEPPSSTYALLKWKERQLLAGLLELIRSGHADWLDVDLDDRQAVDGYVNDAFDASGTSLAADRGTHVHLLCERIANEDSYDDLLG